MKKVSSIKNLRHRKGCKVVRRKTASGRRRILVICPTNPKFKAVQG